MTEEEIDLETHEYVLEIITHANNHGWLSRNNEALALGLEGVPNIEAEVVELLEEMSEDEIEVEEYYPQTYRVEITTYSNNHFLLCTGTEDHFLESTDPDAEVNALEIPDKYDA